MSRWSLVCCPSTTTKLAFFFGPRSAAECLEAALNTLSRALETNCDDPEVWSHYLSLFSRRGSKEEVQEMCEMAVEHAANYQVWWNVGPVLGQAFSYGAKCLQTQQ